jgi:hypothetical protein
MKKREKTTSIFFNEADANAIVCTYNTKLKKRLLEFAEECPELCRLVASDEDEYMEFEVNKDNFTFRCLKPPSDEKREKAREQMNKLRDKSKESSATISETKFIPKDEWKRRFER